MMFSLSTDENITLRVVVTTFHVDSVALRLAFFK